MNDNPISTEESSGSFKLKNLISSTLLILAVLILTVILSLQVGSSVPSVEAAPNDLVCPADMLAYWTLDESASPFVDVIQGNNATCTNCPANLAAGRVGSALTFDGNNDRLTVPHNNNYNFGASFSIELWVQMNSTTCDDGDDIAQRVWVSKRTGGSGGARWWVGCDRQSGGGNTDRAAFYLRDSGGSNQLTLYSTSAIDNGQWHHVVAVRDDAANLNRLYVDGVQVASGTNNSYNDNYNNTGNLTIGAYQSGTTSFNSYTNGNLDEIALYNRALTPAEIIEHYNNGIGLAYCIEAIAPQIESVADQTAIVGQLFTYDVQATGTPAPTFSLVEAPAGMTIDATTGVISWTPATTGSFDVTVQATNSAGSTTISFSITVNALPAITAIPDQTAVVGNLFTYDVEATGVPAPTFSLVEAPAGMTIDATTGLIEWTPDATGSVPVTVRASNVAGNHDASFGITVNSLPAITAIPDQMAVVGQLFTYDVEATGVPAPTFSLVEAPAGMTIDATTGLIEWTPDATGSVDVTVEATNSVGSHTASFSITVNALPSITAIPDQTTAAGDLFTYDVEATGVPDPTFSLVEAPAGMTIDAATGVISWTPDTGGVYNVTVQATNDAGSDTASFSITVNALPAITAIPDQGAVAGQLFSYDVEATGFPAPTFSLVEAPDGMTIDATTGVISWTPDADGVYNVTVEATNDVGSVTASFTITVSFAPFITAIPDQMAVVGQLFTYDVEATGVPAPTFSLVEAPSGMTIDAATGLIEWTPDTTGSFDVTVEATNDAGSDTASFSITVNALPSITAIPDQTVTAGDLFTYDVEATGVPDPTFSLVEAPAGMTIDAATGVISWTPDTGGVYNVTVEATNAAGSDTASFSITVNALPAITAIPDQTAVVGQLFSYDVEATGTPAPTFSLIGAPNGMTIDAATGVISWTPTATGSFNITVQATNSVGSVTSSFSLTVNSLPSITAIPDQTAVAGELFTYNVQSLGVPAPTFSLVEAPSGMTIHAITGVISWTPATTGSFDVTVRASNAAGSDDESFSITVNSHPAITPIPSQTAIVGQLFTYDVEATGVPAPTFSILSGPVGMTINATTGVISWTPTTVGSINVNVRAQNSVGSATAVFTINVEEAEEVGYSLFLPTVVKVP